MYINRVNIYTYVLRVQFILQYTRLIPAGIKMAPEGPPVELAAKFLFTLYLGYILMCYINSPSRSQLPGLPGLQQRDRKQVTAWPAII